jgi:hypothetical protein
MKGKPLERTLTEKEYLPDISDETRQRALGLAENTDGTFP